MQKIKFKIKGMHCKSCAALIEGKLKGRAGITVAKVSYDSATAVVVYDEKKIKESEIYRLVEETGEYQVEKDSLSQQPDSPAKPSLPAKHSFLLGLLISIGVISVIANIFFIGASLKDNQAKAQPSVVENNPTQPSPANQPSQPTPAVQNFVITQANHVRGNFEAPITLVEFSDFECPYCESHYPTLKKILNDYPDKVRLVYKHFPLPFHQNAQKAAEASECAGEQGKFWEYHDKLFESLTEQGYSLENFKKWAREIGLNGQKFDSCLAAGKYAQKVQVEAQEGVARGVNGTPATFVNGRLVSGAVPYETFKQIIDQILIQ